MVKAGLGSSPARAASRASSRRSSRARAAASQRCGTANWDQARSTGLAKRPLSSSRPAPSLAAPTKYIQLDASSVVRTDASASRTCASVSSLRPVRNTATPIHPWAAARFRSIAKARSHSAMPWTARLPYMRRTPNVQWALALIRIQFEGFAQVELGSAEPLRAVVGQIVGGKDQVEICATDQRIDVVSVEVDCPVVVGTCFTRDFGGNSLPCEGEPKEIVIH